MAGTVMTRDITGLADKQIVAVLDIMHVWHTLMKTKNIIRLSQLMYIMHLWQLSRSQCPSQLTLLFCLQPERAGKP
jgi:hypothetical protein